MRHSWKNLRASTAGWWMRSGHTSSNIQHHPDSLADGAKCGGQAWTRINDGWSVGRPVSGRHVGHLAVGTAPVDPYPPER